MSKNNGQGDYKGTNLYRNAKAVMHTLDDTNEKFRALEIEHQRLRAQFNMLVEEHRKTRHMVDTMWVKWMGHGATE